MRTPSFAVISFLITSLFSWIFLWLTVTPAHAALSYGSGTYTNLCGSGTAATAASCNHGCQASTGSCSSSQATVVKFVCDGRLTDCRQNESSFATSHNVSGVSCGKTVQLDVFSKNCRDATGAWTCNGGELQDYMVWYSGDCQTSSTTTTANLSCSQEQPVNTQFRITGTQDWVSGSELSQTKPQAGTQIDVNCFAKNGTALLTGGVIEVITPTPVTQTLSQTPEVRGYRLDTAGNYYFRCYSQSIANCANTDAVVVSAPVVQAAAAPAPVSAVQPTTVVKTAAVTTNPTTVAAVNRESEHRSSCDDLEAISGNGSLVPAKIRLRARASDNKGSIQRYRYYFGDGQQTETDQAEVEHTYDSSGTFSARVDAKDSQGNWQTSSYCQTRVVVAASAVESHKAGCSDLYITANNGAMAPTTISFRVSGYDNKGSLQRYKVDFGNTQVQESSGTEFEQRYTTAGTYTVRAYVQDSQGNWRGGDESCKRTVYVSTKPLTSQPATGTPTVVSVMGAGSGVLGSLFWWLKQRYETVA